MGLVVELVIILVLILLNGVFAMSEMALVSSRKARLAILDRSGPRTVAARALADNPQAFLPTVQVGVTLVSMVAGVLGGARLADALALWLANFAWIRPVADTMAFAVVVIGITYLTIVLGELVPKQLALRRPEAIALVVARPLSRLTAVAAPVVWLLSASSDLVLRIIGSRNVPRQAVTEEELKALLAEGARAGVLESEERDMIERVLRLADKPVRAIMTPRTELIWIDRNDPVRRIAGVVKSAPHGRFVVCDGAVDNVIGVVQAKDLLDRLLEGGEFSIAGAVRQPMVVPDTASALDALERLKADPLGLALVMDEYGSFEGVVTATDVLHAIVGDPDDWAGRPTHPDDAGTPDARGAETMILDGLAPVDDLKERLGLPDLPAEGDYHTIGGLVLALLRRVPAIGDRIVFGGWRFEVLDMDGRRVDRVSAAREPAALPEPVEPA